MEKKSVILGFILAIVLFGLIALASAEDWNLGGIQIFTSVNITNLNITDGSASSMPAGVITSGKVRNASLPDSALNRSDTNIYSANTSNISVIKQSNGSYSINTVKADPDVYSANTDNITVTKTGENRFSINTALGVGGVTDGSVNYFVATEDTVYQNTNGLVFLSMTGTVGGTSGDVLLYADSSNPPTTIVSGTNSQSATYYVQNTAIIQNNWYYKIVVSGTTWTNVKSYWVKIN